MLTEAALAEGVEFTRELVTEPANIIYPESFVERAKRIAVDVETRDEQLRTLGPGAGRRKSGRYNEGVRQPLPADALNDLPAGPVSPRERRRAAWPLGSHCLAASRRLPRRSKSRRLPAVNARGRHA